MTQSTPKDPKRVQLIEVEKAFARWNGEDVYHAHDPAVSFRAGYLAGRASVSKEKDRNLDPRHMICGHAHALGEPCPSGTPGHLERDAHGRCKACSSSEGRG